MTSTIKVNKIEKESGSTLTLGGPSTAVTLACGATQTGFGRTGTVDWCTTAKTSPLTGVSGNGYFINTTGGAVTVTLPASPSAGDIIAIQDYANTAATNNIIVGRNSSKIDGGCIDATITGNGESFTLIYVDGTEGWKTVNNANKQIDTALFVTATGGTESTSGNFKIHKFTSSDNFVVSNAGNASGSNTVEYLVVAGGGGGGGDLGGGGGAGGYRTTFPSPATGGLAVPVATYPITVGAGATSPSGPQPGAPITASTSGSVSTFSSITSAGGGGGGQSQVPYGGSVAAAGGSGGGGSGYAPCGKGAGNTPPVSPPQGNNGGAGGSAGTAYPGGGGGGAAAVGGSSTGASCAGMPGGAGAQNNIDGNNYYWSGGGGGSGYNAAPSGGPGGIGGGGGAGRTGTNPVGTGGGSAINSGSDGSKANPGAGGVQGGAGGANSGGGGGAAGHSCTPGIQPASKGGNGGSGIVIIRYKFQ